MWRTRTIVGVLAAVACVAIPAVASAGGAHASAAHQVIIKGFAFTPGHLVIHRNDTVTWHFEDAPTPHNVTSTTFRSSKTATTGTYTVRFAKAGTYKYSCTIHSWMTAEVVVH
jgi:plastocyanin